MSISFFNFIVLPLQTDRIKWTKHALKIIYMYMYVYVIYSVGTRLSFHHHDVHKVKPFAVTDVLMLVLFIYFYFLLPISRESIVFGSNFRSGDFDGFTRFEAS